MSTSSYTKVSSKKGNRPERLVLEPVRPVLKPVRRQPTWTMEATTPTSASSYLSEEEWPPTAPSKEGRPTLGLMPKKSSNRPPSPPTFITKDKKVTWRHAPQEREASPASDRFNMEVETDSEDRENTRPSSEREKTAGARRKRSKKNKKNKEPARDSERPNTMEPSRRKEEPVPSQQKRARLEERPLPREEKRRVELLSKDSSSSRRTGSGSKDPRNPVSNGSPKGGSNSVRGSQPKGQRITAPASHSKEQASRGHKRNRRPVRRQGGSGSSSAKAESNFLFTTTSRRLISKEMLPSPFYELEGKMVKYEREGDILRFSREYKEDKARPEESIAFPSRPVVIVDSLHHPTLPLPSEDSPAAIRKNPRLLLLPTSGPCLTHHQGGTQCSCFPTTLTGRFHRAAVLHDSCLKIGQLHSESIRVRPNGLQFQENPGHFYVWNPVQKDHMLGVPPPFPLGGSWTNLQYEPAMASRGQEHAVDLYYTLYDSDRFREVAHTYQTEPRLWEAGKSPVLCEASPSNEVGLLAQRLYGLESIPRLGFTAHPAAEPRILLYPAMCRATRVVPVIEQDLRHPARLDLVIAEAMRPFWERAEGMIVCPICLMVPKAGGVGFVAAAYSRTLFLQHWEAVHYSSYVASVTFSATQLHTRIYMGHSLYTLTLANRRKGKDAPTGKCYDAEAMRSLQIQTLDYTLAKAYPMEGFQGRVPGDPQEPPLVDISMEDAQLQQAEASPAQAEDKQEKSVPRKFPRKPPTPKGPASSPASGATPRPASAPTFAAKVAAATNDLAAGLAAITTACTSLASPTTSNPAVLTSTPKRPASQPQTQEEKNAEYAQFLKEVKQTIGEETAELSKPADLLEAAMEAIADPVEDKETASTEVEAPFILVKKGKKKK